MTPWIVFRAYQDPIPQVSAPEAILNWMTSLVRMTTSLVVRKGISSKLLPPASALFIVGQNKQLKVK